MGHWQEIKDVVQKGAHVAAEGMKEGTYRVMDKTQKGSQAVRIKTGVFMKQRELHNILADFGDLVFDAYQEKKDIYADPEIKKTAGQVQETENACKILQDTK